MSDRKQWLCDSAFIFRCLRMTSRSDVRRDNCSSGKLINFLVKLTWSILFFFNFIQFVFFFWIMNFYSGLILFCFWWEVCEIRFIVKKLAHSSVFSRACERSRSSRSHVFLWLPPPPLQLQYFKQQTGKCRPIFVQRIDLSVFINHYVPISQ